MGHVSENRLCRRRLKQTEKTARKERRSSIQVLNNSIQKFASIETVDDATQTESPKVSPIFNSLSLSTEDMEWFDLLHSDENMGNTCSPLVIGSAKSLSTLRHTASLTKQNSELTLRGTPVRKRSNRKRCLPSAITSNHKTIPEPGKNT